MKAQEASRLVTAWEGYAFGDVVEQMGTQNLLHVTVPTNLAHHIHARLRLSLAASNLFSLAQQQVHNHDLSSSTVKLQSYLR
jgi:hypothetical protein